MLTQRFADALAYATLVHRNQHRKGGESVPYIGHLLGVADLVLAAGGDEDEAIAALLHDAAEDQGGEAELESIAARFGGRVSSIVRECSDSLKENKDKKEPWNLRKERYHERLRAGDDPSVLLVSAADKLNNARATWLDWRAVGPNVWERFSKPKTEQIWNYRELLQIYKAKNDPRLAAIVAELERTVDDLEQT